MQTALVDGASEISAARLARCSNEERASYRGRLSCPDRKCGALVHFRSRSVDGRPAHFYSYCHIPTCSEKSPEAKRTFLEVDRVEDEAIWNDASELVLRLDRTYMGRISTIESGEVPRAWQGRTHDPRRGVRHSHASSIGLRPLLRRLRDDRAFKGSNMSLTLSDGTQGTVAQLCTYAPSYIHSGQRRIVWGPITRATEGWINSGLYGQDLPAVRIPDRYRADVLSHAYAENVAHLNQKGGSSFDFIVEGIFRETKDGTPYVTIEGPSHLAILPVV